MVCLFYGCLLNLGLIVSQSAQNSAGIQTLLDVGTFVERRQLEMVEEVLIVYRLRGRLRRLSREVSSVCRGRIN
jgi:hypothetical protein